MRFVHLILATALVACGGTEPAELPPDMPADLGAAEGTGDLGAPEARDRFGLHVGTTGGDATGLVLLVDDVTAEGELDLATGLTVERGSNVFASPFLPDRFFVFDGAQPVLTRYRVTPDGRFEEEEQLAFPGLLTPPRFLAPASFVFADERRAYLFDAFAAELILWDPVELSVIDAIAVPTEDVPGPNLLPLVAVEPGRAGQRVVYPISFANSVTDIAHPRTLVAVLDTETDSLETLLVTETCGYLRHVWITEDGDALLSTDIFSTAVNFASEGARAGPSCVLRLDLETMTLDDAPVLAEGEALGGNPGGSFAFVSDDRAFVRVLDLDALPDGGALTTVELTNGAYWRWGFVDGLDGASFRFVEGATLGTGFARALTVHGRRLSTEPIGTDAGTRVVELGVDGSRRPGVRTGQNLLHVFALRY
ncbi:MAG: hypothetical protein AAGH15_24820 [Myxococcota bacterium]